MFSLKELTEFGQQGYTHVPLVTTIPVGAEVSPVHIYQALAQGPYSYLLESAEPNKQWGRYSLIGLPCAERIEVHDTELRFFQGTQVKEMVQCEDPLAWIDDYRQTMRVLAPASEPRFLGGLVGYLGYECVGYMEPRLKPHLRHNKQDDIQVPDIVLLLSWEVLVFDNESQTITLIVHAKTNAETDQAEAYAQATQRIGALEQALKQSMAPLEGMAAASTSINSASFHSQFGEENYRAAVERVQEYIGAGDVMQAVLSQRVSTPFDGHPLACYHAMRKINPSPYMYYLDLEQFHIVGSSPELLVRVEDGEAMVRPIAGTRPRGKDEQHDQALACELLEDEKERAEHLMLIDLGRNDLGRICQTGSVRVVENMVVEYYSHVMHMVSRVVGRKHEDKSLIDVLRATFPAGTVSGAPKIRAMELIAEMETIKRGIYSGAVGYMSWNQEMDWAIAIRTLVIKNQMLYAQAGAGIVYDSKPQKEWDETINKLKVAMRVAQICSQNATP